MYKNKFGKNAAIVFAVVHIAGLAVVAGGIYLIIKLL